MSAVTSAGKELIDFQAKNYKSLEKWNKFEAVLVTQADLKSDEIIKNIIKKRSNFGILSEESRDDF